MQQLANEEDKRWENWRIANSKFPLVRQIELRKQLELTAPNEGESILEVGTGNGYLTFELAKSVGLGGRVITCDYTQSNLDFVHSVNHGRFPITLIKQDLGYNFDFPNEYVDKISTIATLHHYDNRDKQTGMSCRQKAMKEFYRLLKKDGVLVIGDVAHNTDPQRYFDAIDSPFYAAPRGHPHDFLDERLAYDLCSIADFRGMEFIIADVPWVFRSEGQAKEFVHTLHNAQCSPDESLAMVKKYLSYSTRTDGRVEIGWQLFYLVAKK